MRLIDADAIKRRVVIGGSEQCKKCALVEMLDEIENAPTVEAEPIRQGHWKTNVYASQVVVCSFCNNTSLVPTTYCSNCGAKMDEEDINE